MLEKFDASGRLNVTVFISGTKKNHRVHVSTLFYFHLGLLVVEKDLNVDQ